jgi:recombination protein RecT
MSNKLAIQKTLDKYGGEILKALPAAMQSPQKLDRMRRIAMSEINKNPELLRCDPLSIMGSLVHIATFGLEPGAGFGHAYLVPFKGQCTVIIGYRGMIELARRSGDVSYVHSRCVYKNDKFELIYGTEDRLSHIPCLDDRGELIGAYAIAKLKDGTVMFEYMSKADIDKVKPVFSYTDKKTGERVTKSPKIWDDYYDEMSRKTVVRRLYKYLPSSPEAAQAIELEDTEPEHQKNWEVIDADYTPPEPDINDKKIGEMAEQDAEERALDARREKFNNLLLKYIAEGHDDHEIIKACKLDLDFKASELTNEQITVALRGLAKLKSSAT